MTQAKNSFRYFDSSPVVIRLVVMMYVRPETGVIAKSQAASCLPETTGENRP